MIEFSYKPDWLWLALAATAATAFVLWSYSTAIGRPKKPLRFLLFALRLLVLAGVLLCLLDPQRVERLEHPQPARLAVLLDTSRSMAIRDLPQDRLTTAETWLRDTVLPVLPPNASVSWFGFDRKLTFLSGGSALAKPPFDGASPTGQVTGIAGALDQLLTAQASDPCLGILLCSDGIETTRQDPVAVARQYRRKGIPIYTAAFGTTNENRDIIVENVQIKRAVTSQSRSRILVTIRSQGFANESVPVQIRSRNQVVAEKTLLLTGGAQSAELEFSPRGKGYQVFEASVPVQRGEWLATNNRRPFGLEVVDPTIHVLYMEGTPTQARIPEWKYLKDALESDPNIKCKVLYRHPGKKDVGVNTVDADPITGDPVYHVMHPTRGFPHTLAGLLEYDLVINSDIAKESFSSEQLLNTAKLVEEYGGGFVMIGGKKSFGAGGYHRTIMNKFIPVAMENDADTVSRPFQMTITPQAISHPLIALGANLDETVNLWTRKLPRLHGYNRVGRAKPGAITLAVDPDEENEFGPRVILAVQEVGKGRTMAFTSDTTRSWGGDFETIWGERINANRPLTEINCDSRYYRHFWINAVRWLAAGKIGNTNNPVTLELAQTVCGPEESVPATIRVLGANQRETGDAEVLVSLAVPNQTNRVWKAQFDATTRLYRANVSPPAGGDYTLSATASFKNLRLGEDKKLLVCEESDPEMEKVRVNAELLGDIARASGGECLAPADRDATALRGLLGKVPPPTVEFRRTPLWDRTLWLAILVGLLATEWALRRRRGLA